MYGHYVPSKSGFICEKPTPAEFERNKAESEAYIASTYTGFARIESSDQEDAKP
jgi:hypothetical protein